MRQSMKHDEKCQLDRESGMMLIMMSKKDETIGQTGFSGLGWV